MQAKLYGRIEWGRELRRGLSTHVFDDSSDKSAVLYGGSEHLWDRFLFENAFFLSFDRQTDVYRATLRRDYLHPETAFRQVDLPRVCRVELDGGSRTGDLDGERRRSSNGD